MPWCVMIAITYDRTNEWTNDNTILLLLFKNIYIYIYIEEYGFKLILL